jgi:hypothetical protein
MYQGLLTAEDRRVLSAVKNMDAYAEECSGTAPCAQPPKSWEYIGVTLQSDCVKFQGMILVLRPLLPSGCIHCSQDAARTPDQAAVLADMYAPRKRGGACECRV